MRVREPCKHERRSREARRAPVSGSRLLLFTCRTFGRARHESLSSAGSTAITSSSVTSASTSVHAPGAAPRSTHTCSHTTCVVPGGELCAHGQRPPSLECASWSQHDLAGSGLDLVILVSNSLALDFGLSKKHLTTEEGGARVLCVRNGTAVLISGVAFQICRLPAASLPNFLLIILPTKRQLATHRP